MSEERVIQISTAPETEGTYESVLALTNRGRIFKGVFYTESFKWVEALPDPLEVEDGLAENKLRRL